jgi:hypothetical protein
MAAPVPSSAAPPVVLPAAGAPAAAMIDYLRSLAAHPAEDREPMQVAGFEPERPETNEPQPLD